MKLNLASVCALLLAAPVQNALAKSLAEDYLSGRDLNGGVHASALEIAARELSQAKRDVQHQVVKMKLVARTDANDFDEAAFNATAIKACESALGSLKSSVNPSGIVACYNVAFMDNSTGVFQTDLRLYQLSTAVGTFAGTNAADYSLSVEIPEATLSSPTNMVSSSSISSANSSSGTLTMLQGFSTVGQLNTKLSMAKLTTDKLRILMIPNITISTNNLVTTGQVSTTLSSDTLSYVAGELVESTPANITFPEAKTLTTAIVATATKFVYPGQHILVSLNTVIVTSIWTGLFIAVVAFGTIGRYRFRQSYRQRAAVARAPTSGPKGF